ncbi:MAG: glycosyltransferase family 4 protein [Butyrivibrio sp.]|nr:glycosyltransferase family 4 protein [Butyrivibrio sp.]
MRITFVSNYINHHQLPFCDAMQNAGDDVQFSFIQVMPMEEKRVSMGWGVDEAKIPYLVLYYEEPKKAAELIRNSDVVLFGWTEGKIKELEEERLSSGKLSFRVSERIYREGQWKAVSPKGLVSKYKEHIRYRKLPVYLLCTGAYVASDFDLIKAYPKKKLKWGYFPDASGIGAGTSADSHMSGQNAENKLRICWAGRMIPLKHPEYALKLARALSETGCDFTLDMVGDGRLLPHLKTIASGMGLTDKVNFTGGKAPMEVLDYMKRADIFLFTSNYIEGWGAVVNEAMQNGCCVVASKEAGAVPFLIKDGENGLIYDKGDYEELERAVLGLVNDRDRIKKLGEAAAETIEKIWNADNAAKELLRFCREYLEGKEPSFAKEGPMSVAEHIKAPGFIRTLREDNHLE